jgi:glycosyltransferase involved in cell wall biosynthesis
MSNMTASLPAYPVVSAVIPTRRRPELVKRAVASALAQTLRDIEVLVVVDGPDETTKATLASFSDNRLRVLELPEPVGGSEARNIGVKNALGKWIAFLDDDDEWLPEKLQRQVAAGSASRFAQPVVLGRFLGRSARGEFIWPRRAPRADEQISEYLFCRNGLLRGEGQFQTSVVLAPRVLLERVPFTPGLRRNQDIDWYLRVVRAPGVGIEFIPEPLSIWYFDQARKTISNSNPDWRDTLTWMRDNADLFTPRAYSGFIATQLAPEAYRERAWSAALPLLREFLRGGSPTPLHFAIYLSAWLTPEWLRQLTRVLSSARQAR